MPRSAVFWITPNCTCGDIMFRYLLILVPTVPSAPHTTGTVFISVKFQHFCNSISSSLYFVSFSATFRTMLVHTGIATLMIKQVRSSESWISISRLHSTSFCRR